MIDSVVEGLHIGLYLLAEEVAPEVWLFRGVVIRKVFVGEAVGGLLEQQTACVLASVDGTLPGLLFIRI